MKLFLVLAFLCLSACTITRYYKTGDLQNQVNGLNGQIDGNVAKLEADYQTKQKFLDGAKATGADPAKAPYDSLYKEFRELGAFRDATLHDAAAARAQNQKLTALIGGRGRVNSSDPAYAEIGDYEKSAQSAAKTLNASFGAYTAHANLFAAHANATEVFTVDVPSFTKQLATAIGSMDSQCAAVDAKIGDANQTLKKPALPKREERLTLLAGMRDDVTKIRASRDDLATFQSRFLAVSKGKTSIVVGPHLPHHKLFLSLSGITDETGKAVASFNGKVDVFNKL
jgi:hypothetical protein